MRSEESLQPYDQTSPCPQEVEIPEFCENSAATFNASVSNEDMRNQEIIDLTADGDNVGCITPWPSRYEDISDNNRTQGHHHPYSRTSGAPNVLPPASSMLLSTSAPKSVTSMRLPAPSIDPLSHPTFPISENPKRPPRCPWRKAPPKWSKYYEKMVAGMSLGCRPLAGGGSASFIL